MKWSIKITDDLEEKQKWGQAISELKQRWIANKGIKEAIKLGFLCWYVIVEEHCINTEDVDIEDARENLKYITRYSIDTYSGDIDILWIYGYMISMFPEQFESLGDYLSVQQIGIDMITKAHMLRPDDSIIELIFMGSKKIKDINKYEQVCKKVIPLLDEKFDGSGILSVYFKEVLNRGN